MIEHIISGPILAFEILGKNAINICLDLIGPEDPDNARKMYPETVRAQYGIDKIRNGIHVSTSTKSAERVRFFNDDTLEFSVIWNNY